MRRPILTALTALLALLALAPPARAGDWVWPLRGEVITPYRNGDDPYAAGQHRGIDIAADAGAPVLAAAGGEVRFAGIAGSSGLTVSIRTADGRYDTSYLHLSATNVREGDRVAAGSRVGAVGTTGVRSAERPHLHFGIRDAGSRHAYHDPLNFLAPLPAAPEAPRATPLPHTAPAPATPSPAPVPTPMSARGAAGAGAAVPERADGRLPVHVPGVGRVQVPLASGRHAPGAARHAGSVADPRRAGARRPSGATRPAPLPGPTVHPRSVPGAARAPSTAGATVGGLGPAGAPDASRARGAWTPPKAAQHGPLAKANRSSGAGGHALGGPTYSPGLRTGDASTGPAANTSADRSTTEPSLRSPEAGPRGASQPGTAPGPDIGLVLACLGLLAAAAVLGLKGGDKQMTRPARSRTRPADVWRSLAGRLPSRG